MARRLVSPRPDARYDSRSESEFRRMVEQVTAELNSELVTLREEAAAIAANTSDITSLNARILTVPSANRVGAYTLVAADAGTRVRRVSGAAPTWTLPNPLPWPVDTLVEMSNGATSGNISLTSTGAAISIRHYTGAGRNDVTTLAIAPGGWARVYVITSTIVEVWGVGLS